MLYATPALDSADQQVLAESGEIRRDLRHQLAEPHRWDGQLRRNLEARAVQGSNSIEGYHATLEDVESVVAGEVPLEASAQVSRELVGYRQALSYIQVLGCTRHFRYEATLLHALNFMMIGHHTGKAPGTPRPGCVFIRNGATGETVYEGPDAERVPALMDELVTWLNEGDLDAHVYVRAAMAHLNLVKIHPWRDGNARGSRALQTLVLARDGVLSPQFSSIEEWLGVSENTVDYYRVLGDVGGREWSPHRDTHSWVRFCLRAHHMQAQAVRQRLREAADVWCRLDERIEAEGLHSRCVSALYQVFVSRRLRRATYQSDEVLSPGQATRDLRELAKRGWLAPYGETKGRFYAPGPLMMEIRADFERRREPLRDPYRRG
ncbi:Fic family protein [Spinactinospora alkalitolerans]|uniref:Fic family protein n=1 Tax=Spinactinospora alkalitolerans TaxID=687207 RepID=A0A852TYD1_9ACTN|nr:Fic family protein [Spinactinospora alkalitolerans]NYE48345.1 Fic family protein [Spinactinospora alkalitolerans]